VMALWILAASALAQETERDVTPEDLISILEALKESPGARQGTLLQVDPQSRMNTVLLRYGALKKQMEQVPGRNRRRFEADLKAVLEKAPPLVAGVTVARMEIIDLRNRPVDSVRETEDPLVMESPDNQSKRESPSIDSRASINPEPEKEISKERLQEMSATLKEIAEELSIHANEEIQYDAPASTGTGQGR
ncbi:MAG: hypothetical protein KC917_22375, partial [Candidatus Omnitrophica bacterium]|nr:hypothetical protein [Candidatus Omnitrophota bacterium]